MTLKPGKIFDRAIICAKNDPFNPRDTRLELYRQEVMKAFDIERRAVAAYPSVEGVQLFLRDRDEIAPNFINERTLLVVEPTTTIRTVTWSRIVSAVKSANSENIFPLVAVDTERAHSQIIVDPTQYMSPRIPNPTGPQDVVTEATNLGYDVLRYTLRTEVADIQGHFAALAKSAQHK